MRTLSQSQTYGGLRNSLYRVQLAVRSIDITKVNCPVGIVFSTNGLPNITQSLESPRPVEFIALDRVLDEMVTKAHADWHDHLRNIIEQTEDQANAPR